MRAVRYRRSWVVDRQSNPRHRLPPQRQPLRDHERRSRPGLCV